LGAQIESAPSETELFRRARDGYRAWAESLRTETGIDVGYKQCGALQIAMNDGDAEALRARGAEQVRLGLTAEIVDGARARTIEPALADRIAYAAHFPDDAQVDPPAPLRALV